MPRSATLPFSFKRSRDELTSTAVTTTSELVHGLLRLHGDTVTIQWRLTLRTDHVGLELRTDEEVEPVRELSVPVRQLAGATVRRSRWWWPKGPRVVLTASDLTALEGLAGGDGLSLTHPAEVELRIRRSDRLVAEEFCAELAMAVSELIGIPTDPVLPPQKAPREDG